MMIDPICGMSVDPSFALQAQRDGKTAYFCSESCRSKFLFAEKFTQLPSTTTACCNGQHQQISPLANSNYFCPMCPGQESAIAGECHHCGMALERNPSFSHSTFYTCPMHPQVRQETPGDCPLCGMPLEQITESNEDLATAELTDITRRFWIGTALTLPVLLLAMAHMIPSLSHDPRVIGNSSRWTRFILSSPVVFWVAWPFF